jgi:hypothetical protein
MLVDLSPCDQRESAGVRFAKGDREIFRERAAAPGLEKFGDVVGGSDFAEASCGGERSVAITGGDIEDARAGAEVERFAEIFADGLDGGADDSVVAGGPGELLAGFDGAVVGACGGHGGFRSKCGARAVRRRVSSRLGMRANFGNDRASETVVQASVGQILAFDASG